MKLQKHETRKDFVLMLLLVLIPITSLLYTKYPITTDGLNPILFGSALSSAFFISLCLLDIPYIFAFSIFAFLAFTKSWETSSFSKLARASI